MRRARGLINVSAISVLLAVSGVLAAMSAAAIARPVHDWLGVTPKGVSFTFSSDGRRVTNFQARLL